MMRKIQQAMQDDDIQTARIHPAFIQVAGLKCSLPRSRLEKPRSWEPSQLALSYEHIENFTKDLEVRRVLGNRPSPIKQAQMKRLLEWLLFRRGENRTHVVDSRNETAKCFFPVNQKCFSPEKLNAINDLLL